MYDFEHTQLSFHFLCTMARACGCCVYYACMLVMLLRHVRGKPCRRQQGLHITWLATVKVLCPAARTDAGAEKGRGSVVVGCAILQQAEQTQVAAATTEDSLLVLQSICDQLGTCMPPCTAVLRDCCILCRNGGPAGLCRMLQ